MRKLALSVAVALSSFLGQPAFAVEIEEAYLICNSELPFRIAGEMSQLKGKYFISIKDDVAEVQVGFFEIENYLFEDKFYMLKKIELQAMKPFTIYGEFQVTFDSTPQTPTMRIDRTSLKMFFPDGKKRGDCEIEEKITFRKALSLTREIHRKEFDSIIQKLNAESKKEFRKRQEKLSQRKF